eukprot:407545-Prymnesium_polylepis.1
MVTATENEPRGRVARGRQAVGRQDHPGAACQVRRAADDEHERRAAARLRPRLRRAGGDAARRHARRPLPWALQ